MDRLARNAMLAREAGMTYGKWKALQPVVEVEKPDVPEGMVICEWCRKPFKQRCHKRFCNDDCRVQAYAAKKREMAKIYMRGYRVKQREEKYEKTTKK